MLPANPANPKQRGLVASLSSGVGWLLIALLSTGWALETQYRGTAEQANASVQSMRESSIWKLVGDAHYWGSGLLIVASALLVAAMLWTGRFRSPFRAGYYFALGSLLVALGFQITGNLLPFQRHDVQTAVVEAGIAGSTPVVGDAVSKLMLQGDGFSAGTLSAWHFAHKWLLPLACLALLWLGHAGRKSAGERSSPTLASAPILVAVALALFVSAPTGEPATSADYRAFNATVSWYVWPMHATLVAFQTIDANLGWIGSALLPGLLVAFLFVLPWLPKGFGKPVARLSLLAISVGGLALGILFGGPVAAPTGDQKPIEIFAAESGGDPPPIDAPLAARGAELFAKHCAGCHSKDASGGSAAPDLRQVWRRNPSPERLVQFIGNPKSLNPRSTMPGFPELGLDLRPLAEFVRKPRP